MLWGRGELAPLGDIADDQVHDRPEREAEDREGQDQDRLVGVFRNVRDGRFDVYGKMAVAAPGFDLGLLVAGQRDGIGLFGELAVDQKLLVIPHDVRELAIVSLGITAAKTCSVKIWAQSS